MIDRAPAKRYAEALVQLAVENGVVDRVELDLALVVNALETEPEFRQFFEHAQLKWNIKVDFVRRVFSGVIEPLTLDFLSVVLRKGRERYLSVIFEEYVELANEVRGRADVHVETGRPIPEEEISLLREELSRFTGKDVRLHISTNPELIAGIRIRIGDMVLDGSLAGRLESLRRKLQAADVEQTG